MEKKLRRKFILMSMLSLTVVLLVLFGSINIFSYTLNTKMQDRTLHRIAEGGIRMPPNFPPDAPFGGPVSPEVSAMTRFFVVVKDSGGKIKSTELEFISSVSSEEAKSYAEKVSKKGKTSGYCEEYRYYVYGQSNETIMIFLNCSNQLQQMKILLLLSFILSAMCFLIMLVLVIALSKKAVAPYMKNVEIQKRFITDAGHELKTPLTSIATSADVLALDDTSNEWVENIRTQTLRMSKLVGNLVMMSRLDEEHPIPDRAEFAVSEAIWESAEPFSAAARATGKRLELHIEDGMRQYGDVVSFQQMISVLLDNAIKYSDKSGYIRLDAFRKKQKTIIEVYNTCDLIDTKNLNRLFDRFYRADTSRSARISGTGVGLSIAKAIARAHGGDIIVKSKSGNSITFIVTI
ncbi:MAG: HAMP domain-containing sensor histidine kinase [Oscillospiraceae bacterium]|nr:HAMP domain-containing sensor histidine kinase [Oscillospiraceae bacterium]